MTVELNTPSTLADLIDKELMGVEPDSQCVVLDDADWKMITAALRSSTSEFTRCIECDGYNCDDGCAYPNATPAPAELVRYESTGTTMILEEDANGKYVTYDQAAAMIAAKDGELAGSKQDAEAWKRNCNSWRASAQAARAELAQIKAQVPVAFMIHGIQAFDIFRREPVSDRELKWGVKSTPLYAAPVASEAETIERLREALEACDRMFRLDIRKLWDAEEDNFSQAVFDVREKTRNALKGASDA